MNPRTVALHEDFAACSAQDVREMAARLSQSAREAPPAPLDMADSLARVFEQWRRPDFPRRAETIVRVAERSGMSRELLAESLDALLAPFTGTALERLARRVGARPPGAGAFVMPANVPGAGLHELAGALVAGATAIVKVSSREPSFFSALMSTLSEISPEHGARAAVVNFGRERSDLMESMLDSCDFAVVLGFDETIAALGCRTRLFGFGSRASGALVGREACVEDAHRTAAAVARDVVLFEQRGCLSPHHVFLDGADGDAARHFSESLAEALSALSSSLPPARLPFETASAVRRVRESARWQRIGGRDVRLMEGDAMAWTVVLDPGAEFQVSPGYRTVTVSVVRDLDDLGRRLERMAGRLEVFSLAADADRAVSAQDMLGRLGVTWVCEPGSMQSPPLEWRHGGGAFLDFLGGTAP